MLKKKNIIIIGGTGSLGLSISKYLINLNTKVVVMDLASKKLDNLDKFKNVKTISTDISDEKIFVESFKNAYKFLKQIDCVINCASITAEFFKNKGGFFDEFHEYDLNIWNQSINVNLTGLFLSCRESIKFMIKQKKGSIINFSSIYGVISPNYHLYKNQKFNIPASYSASKSGVIGLTKWLAANYAKSGININSISPGGVFNNQNKNFVDKYSELNPSGRMATKNDINDLIYFLIFSKSQYINGHNFLVDGGHTIW